MKTALLLTVLVAIAASIAFASSGIAFLKTPPPVELPDAYSAAVKVLGTNAAHYHCVLASAIDTHIVREDRPNGAWSFTFVTTNGSAKYVWFFFDTKKAEVVEMPKQAQISAPTPNKSLEPTAVGAYRLAQEPLVRRAVVRRWLSFGR